MKTPLSAQARVVLVTGASSGIGLATVRALAARGDHVVLVARSPERLAEAARHCRELGAASATPVVADVADDEAITAAMDVAAAITGRIDAVINSAAVVAYGDFHDIPAEVFAAVQRTNVLGTAAVARAALAQLRPARGGTLVLVGSLLGQITVPGMSAYVTGKWWVRAFARQLQQENRDLPGLHVCLVTPGGVDTPVYTQAATYLGRVGRPPPPVDPPEKVAAAVLGLLDRPRARRGVGVANPLMVAGFTALPRVYDAIVGPIFRVSGLDAERRGPGPGNVLTPSPDGERLHGGQGPVWRALVRGTVRELRAVPARVARSRRP